MKSAGKARSNGLYRHIRTSKEIIRNLLNDFINSMTVKTHGGCSNETDYFKCIWRPHIRAD